MKISNKSLTIRKNVPAKRKTSSMPIGIIITITIIGLVIYFVLKNKTVGQQYLNKEEWEVKYNEDGLPTKIVIYRNATRNG